MARLRMRVGLDCALLAAALAAGCSSNGEADLTAGGPVWDGHSLRGWRVLRGSWRVSSGALLGVGPKSKVFRAARCPDEYRLRFEVAPHGSPEVDWGVAFPVGDASMLYKGVFVLAGERERWAQAWLKVVATVRPDEVRIAFPGLRERPREARGAPPALEDAVRARQLWGLGFRFHDRADGLVVMARPEESWRAGSRSFGEGLRLGERCIGGAGSGIALVDTCTAAGDWEVPQTEGVRVRGLVVEPL